MDYARAESNLRLLAETELRRVTADNSPDPWNPVRLSLVASALSAAGAVPPDTAAEILANTEFAAAVRRPHQGELSGHGHHVMPSGRPMPARLLYSPTSELIVGTDGSRGGYASHTQRLLQGGQLKVLPVGRVIRFDDPFRELLLAAYIQSESSAWFTVAGWRIGRFTCVDDSGTHYRIGFRGRSAVGVLLLHPTPQRKIRWLDLAAAPGKPTTRIRLDPPQFPVPDSAIRKRSLSPGEFVLNVIATRILTAAAAHTQDTAAVKPELLSHAPGLLGDVVAALNAAQTLPPDSPVPGQLGRLCDILEITGHGITMPPSTELPEQWQSMLEHRYRRATSRTPASLASLASVAVELPELDGARITILGLHQSKRGTILHTLNHDSVPEEDWAYSRRISPLPLIWIHDSNDRWYATRVSDSNLSGKPPEAVVWLQTVPSLDPEADWIEVIATGQSAEAYSRLPLRREK